MYQKSAYFLARMTVIIVFLSQKVFITLDDGSNLGSEFIVITGLALKNGQFGIKLPQRWPMFDSCSYPSRRCSTIS